MAVEEVDHIAEVETLCQEVLLIGPHQRQVVLEKRLLVLTIPNNLAFYSRPVLPPQSYGGLFKTHKNLLLIQFNLFIATNGFKLRKLRQEPTFQSHVQHNLIKLMTVW